MGTALVLGSGGITGIAWTLGVLSTWPHGPFDLVVGSSAGAFAGALDANPPAFAHACDAVRRTDPTSARRDLALALGNSLPHLLAVPGRRGEALVRMWMIGAVARRFAASAG
ncbi:MAG TPA: patatin-like phospholipase family protein, partial [Microbacterium sp.]|uniref:patatin-like phospholipase family protein n=1 Tax=Microbacterium sp. TaxID=51671 RepID=UPI002B488FEA